MQCANCSTELTDTNEAKGRPGWCRPCWNGYKKARRQAGRPDKPAKPLSIGRLVGAVELSDTDRKKTNFLDALLRNGGFVQRAINEVGTSREFVNNAYNTDPAFAQLWDTIIELGNESIESEIYRRAVTGNEKPLAHQGRLTGHTIREYSDNLLMFLAKARMPNKYRDLPQKGQELTDEEITARLEQFIAKRVGKGKAIPVIEAESVN